MRLKSGYRRADRSNSQRNEWIEPYGEDEKREGGGMMADGGGTFRCATMLCGNNAQTNDSAVPTVITRGTRSFFPLLNPLSQPPSNQLSFYVYPFVPLSFLVSLVHLPIHVYTGLPLSLSLKRPTSLVLYPFLIALIAKSTHFRNDDWSAHPRAPSSSIWSTEVQPFPFPFSARLPRCRSGKESSATNRRAPVFFAGFSLCTVMEGPWKRRSILRDLDRGIVVSVDSSSSTANSSTTTVNAFLSFSLSLSFWSSIEDFGDRVSWKINSYGLWRSNITTVTMGSVRLIISAVYVFFWGKSWPIFDTFYRRRRFLEMFQAAGIFICVNYTRSHFVLGHQVNEIPVSGLWQTREGRVKVFGISVIVCF